MYSERSHTPESLQTPAVNSQETTEPPSNGREAIDSSVINSYEDKEISTASGQPRDQLHVVGNVEKSNFNIIDTIKPPCACACRNRPSSFQNMKNIIFFCST